MKDHQQRQEEMERLPDLSEEIQKVSQPLKRRTLYSSYGEEGKSVSSEEAENERKSFINRV